MIYNILVLRYIFLSIIMINNIMSKSNKIYKLMILISIMSIISIMIWPSDIKDINIMIINVIIGYKIMINYNIVGIYMSMVLDVLIWISMIYERYYIINNNCKNIIILYVMNNIFFSSNDMITISIIYEFQNIPLLLIINNLYNQINIYNKKGIGISNILLIFYGIVSGLLLYYSLYMLYLLNHNSNICYNVNILLNNNNVINSYILICILISGSIKLAIFPFHIWLGKVHVEAPTIGSIILAGISLKTGFYIHYLFIYLFVLIEDYYINIFIIIVLVGIVINNINIFYQIDMKRWIALYSIVHMNLYYIILFIIILNLSYTNDINYMLFVIILIYGMIGHSLISGGLFLIIGYIYDITNNKNVLNVNYNILSSYIYFILFLLLLGNSSFPFFILFIFELLAFIHSSLYNVIFSLLLIFLSFSNLLSSLYIFYKYLYKHYYFPVIYFTYYDLLLIILSLPILVLVVLMGINSLLPISLLL